MTAGDHDPPGETYETSVDARVRLVYDDGAWSGTCRWTSSTLWYHDYDENGLDRGPRWENASGEERLGMAPLREPTDVEVGDTVVVEDLGAYCNQDQLYGEIPVVERTSHSAPRQPDGSDSWYAYIQYEWPGDAYAYWDTKTGLVLAWRDQGHYSYNDGWMVDTDAPLS